MIYGPDKFLRPHPSRVPEKEAMSILSSEKARDAAARWLISQNDGSYELALQERQVLSREQAIKMSAAGCSTRTVYTYSTGQDGKRYITGAEVSVTGTEEMLDSIPGGNRTGANAGTKITKARDDGDGESAKPSDDAANDPAIAELEKIQNDVIAHEAAHKAAAGRFGGPVSYTYTTGPDGKRYITGGEVPISTPPTDDPEEALRNALMVARAALAPGDPSGQDIAVAASAAQMASQARAKIASGEGGADEKNIDKANASPPAKNALAAYSSQLSQKGLWLSEGYGESQKIGYGFEIAA
jgi:hypothetical protein